MHYSFTLFRRNVEVDAVFESIGHGVSQEFGKIPVDLPHIDISCHDAFHFIQYFKLVSDFPDNAVVQPFDILLIKEAHFARPKLGEQRVDWIESIPIKIGAKPGKRDCCRGQADFFEVYIVSELFPCIRIIGPKWHRTVIEEKSECSPFNSSHSPRSLPKSR